MKFLRFKYEDTIKNGYYNGEKVIELDDNILNYTNSSIDTLNNNKSYYLNDIKIIEPTNPSKIVCVGLNYKDHCKELNMDLPKVPRIFLKPPSSIIAHKENIIYPKMSNEIDYEGELAIVIGKKSKEIDINEAKDYIFGYTIINDITARDIQREDIQWTRGKSFDTFAPIGPFIETDLNPLNLNIRLTVNGKIKQDSNTKNMVFTPFELISFISKIMTLYPGDIIATGTPPGVGSINKGDLISIQIENIGTLENYLV